MKQEPEDWKIKWSPSEWGDVWRSKRACLTPNKSPQVGDTYKLGLYWVEVVSYSPKTRNVRYRRITAKGKPLAPVESMGRKRFEREAARA